MWEFSYVLNVASEVAGFILGEQQAGFSGTDPWVFEVFTLPAWCLMICLVFFNPEEQLRWVMPSL